MIEEKQVYLDSATSTRVDAAVIDKMNELQQLFYANPSAGHKLGLKAKEQIENARKQCSDLLNASQEEVVFTSSGTEANNTVLRAAFQSLKCKHIITSPIEHYSVRNTINYLKTLHPEVEVHYVKLHSNGHVDLSSLEIILKEFSNETKLVSLMHINNVIGNISDIDSIGGLCKKYKAYFHSDTVQSIGKYLVQPDKSNIDFITASAHKFNGPKGVGFLYVNKKNKIPPLIIGVHQENNLRAGTENISGIAGMAQALQISLRDHDQNKKYLSELKGYLIEQLNNYSIPIQINGDASKSTFSSVNIAFPQHASSNQGLYQFLSDRNICISGGSACIGASGKQSHVIEAIGVNTDKDNVRFSFDKYNTKEEIEKVAELINEFYEK